MRSGTDSQSDGNPGGKSSNNYDGLGYVVQGFPPVGVKPAAMLPCDEKWFRRHRGRLLYVREARLVEGSEPHQPTMWVLVVHVSAREAVVLPFFRGRADWAELNTDLEVFLLVCRHHRKAAEYAAHFVAETTVDAFGNSGRILYFLGNGKIAP